jgi:C-22 sterol desaturase
MTLAHMIGKAAVELYWENHSTSRSEEFNVVATVISMVSSASLGPLRRS